MALWSPNANMPLRGERTCPSFVQSEVSSILRYFQDLEALFGRANLVDSADQKKHAVYYSPADTEHLWKALPEYDDVAKTYTQFRDAITALYGYKALDHAWKLHDLNNLLSEYRVECADTGFQKLERYQAFYRSFSGIVSYLVGNTRSLSQVEAARILIGAFKGDVAKTMKIRLISDPAYDPEAPELAKIHIAALYALKQETSVAGGTGGSGIPREAGTSATGARPTTPDPRADTGIKREELDSFYVKMSSDFALLTHQLHAAMALHGGSQSGTPFGRAGPAIAPQQPPPRMQNLAVAPAPAPAFAPPGFAQRPPPSSLNFCFYCGTNGCHTSSCPSLAEDLASGLIVRNNLNRIELPGGHGEVPRDAIGSNMRARVHYWHTHHPGQRVGDAQTQAATPQGGVGGPAAPGGPTVGGFSYTVSMDSAAGYDVDWSPEALQLHLQSTGGQRKARMVFDGVYMPPRKPGLAKDAAGKSAQPKPATDSAPTPSRAPAPVAPPRAQTPAIPTRDLPPHLDSQQAPAASAPNARRAPAGEEGLPVHPFANAKAVVVDVTQKPPVLPARHPGRAMPQAKPVMKLMDNKALERVQQRLLDKEITVTSAELISISPELAKRIHDGTTVRRVLIKDPVANEAAKIDQMIADLRAAPETAATTALLDELPDFGEISIEEDTASDVMASLSGVDVFAQGAQRNEDSATAGPTSDETVIVARPLSSLRTVWATVGTNKEPVECILDPGSQIIAISEDLSNHLHLVYSPVHTLGMQSANGSVNRSLGVVADVPLEIQDTGITLYVQMHVMRDAAYGVLLGRPFDALASTIVETSSDGVHKLTLRCPNTQRVAVVPTYNRGEGRPEVRKPARTGFQASGAS